MGIFFDISIVMVDLDFSSQEKLVQINLNGAYGRKTIFHEHLLWKIKRVLKIGDCYVIFIIRSIYWKMRKGYLQNCRRFLYYHSFAIGVESHFYSSHLVEDVWIFCFAFKDTIRKNRKLWFYEKSVSFDLLPFRFNGKSSLVWYRVYTYKTNFRNPLWIFNVILWDFCKPRSHQITSSYVWLYCPSMPPTVQYTCTAYGLFVYIHQKVPYIYTCLIKVFYLLGHLEWPIAIGLFSSSCVVHRLWTISHL